MNKILYQIYPLGLTGAPRRQDHQQAHRILQIKKWLPHLKKLHVNTVLFNPVFASSSHGYDTIDYARIDERLGTREDFQEVCTALQEEGIEVMLDAVFNHVGRAFWAFQDVQKNKQNSPFRDWFYIDWNNTWGEDGFTYADWEGHHELVKLNLRNPEVVSYLLEQVDQWIRDYGIRGLRLDVAYCMDHDFLRILRDHVKTQDPDFFLLGEMIQGDYNALLRDGLVDSVTNYECYKGLYSSFNTHNLFEIGYSLNRQFGSDPWCLYTGRPLLSFADNHDVSRLASTLQDPRDLPLAYSLLSAMPGLPCYYYGSEWGITGTKAKGSDDDLRPALAEPVWNELTDTIAALNTLRLKHPALPEGSYQEAYKRNLQWGFVRRTAAESILYLLNIADTEDVIHLGSGQGIDLKTGENVDLESGIPLGAKSFRFIQLL